MKRIVQAIKFKQRKALSKIIFSGNKIKSQDSGRYLSQLEQLLMTQHLHDGAMHLLSLTRFLPCPQHVL